MKVSLRSSVVCIGLAAVVCTFSSGCRTKRPEKGITVIRGGATPSVGNPNLMEAATNIARVTPPNPVEEPVTPVPPPQPVPVPIEPSRPVIEPSTGGIGLPSDLEKLFGMAPDANALKPNTVQFAYDSAAIAAKELAKVKEVAIVLRGQPTNKVVVDGHCDERGTEEYNRSLGERRALKIREQLIKEGISTDRIYTRTFGKDRPSAFGHDDAAWAQNRRGEFTLLRPATGVGVGTP